MQDFKILNIIYFNMQKLSLLSLTHKVHSTLPFLGRFLLETMGIK